MRARRGMWATRARRPVATCHSYRHPGYGEPGAHRGVVWDRSRSPLHRGKRAVRYPTSGLSGFIPGRCHFLRLPQALSPPRHLFRGVCVLQPRALGRSSPSGGPPVHLPRHPTVTLFLSGVPSRCPKGIQVCYGGIRPQSMLSPGT